MTQQRLSLVMTMPAARYELLERSLFATCCWQMFMGQQAELVVVSDGPVKDYKSRYQLRRVLNEFKSYFYQVTWIEMDKARSTIPVFHNCPALGVNLAVKAAENEIVLKTDPECLPLTDTVQNALQLFDPDAIYFFTVRMLTEEETAAFALEALQHKPPEQIFQEKLKDLPDLWLISEQNRCAYWFGALFSRTRFLSIGGVDEEFLRGFAGDDDDWAERMMRSGAAWRWSDQLRILHMYHGSENRRFHLCPEHHANIRRLEESRMQARVVANGGHDWGSDSVVVRRQTL